MSTERYTHGHHESVLRTHSRRTIADSAAYLQEHLVAGRSLLDVGAGPGSITVEFADRLAPGRVVGLDAASAVVARAAAEHVRDNLEFSVGDVYALPFADDAFDIVHAHQVLQHLADPIAALREMHRVARPGGIVAVREVDYGATFWFPAIPGLDAWLALLERVQRGNRGEPDAGRRLVSWVRRAGLQVESTSVSVWNFTTPQQRQWWGGAWADRALHSDFAASALDGGFATRDELEAISVAWRRWADDEDGWFAMPHTEVIAVA